MLALKIENQKLEQEFKQIVAEYYEDNVELALKDAIERLVSAFNMRNRKKMIEIVEKFRLSNMNTENIEQKIENTIKNYRENYEKKA